MWVTGILVFGKQEVVEHSAITVPMHWNVCSNAGVQDWSLLWDAEPYELKLTYNFYNRNLSTTIQAISVPNV